MPSRSWPWTAARAASCRATETVADGSYAAQPPAVHLPGLNRLASNPAIAPFVDYYLSDEGIAKVAEVGYVPLAAGGPGGHPRRLV